MKTTITELFRIRYPIMQGGMHFVGFAELAAAVSNASGIGTITGLSQRTPADLANEIARCKDMTDRPFAVNLTFLPVIEEPDYPGYVKAIIDGGVPVLETAGRNPAQAMDALKGAGIKISVTLRKRPVKGQHRSPWRCPPSGTKGDWNDCR